MILAEAAATKCGYGWAVSTTPFSNTMATPNYSFEKRKREQAKKAAKEAKRLRKKEKSTASATETDGTAAEEAAADPASLPDSPAGEA